MNTSTEVATSNRSTGAIRAFSILNGFVLLGVLLQGVSAGGLIDHLGAGWLRVHQLSAFTALFLALVAAVIAIAALRRYAAGLAS